MLVFHIMYLEISKKPFFEITKTNFSEIGDFEGYGRTRPGRHQSIAVVM